MSRGPLIAVGALAAVAGAAALLLLAGPSPDNDLNASLGGDGPGGNTTVTSVPPVTPPGETTGRLDPVKLVRPNAPAGSAGPTEGPKGPSSRFGKKRGTKRESQDQRAGRLLDNLEQAVTASDGTAIEDFIAKLLAMGEKALPDVIDALQRADIGQRKLRKALINALAKFAHPDAANALMSVALDGTDDRELRKIATLKLGEMPAAVATAPLIRIYQTRGHKDIYGPVRGQALAMLGKIGGDQAYKVVADSSEFEEDVTVRRMAVASLGSDKFDQPGKIELLLKKVRTDADDGVRRWAMSALGSSKDPRAHQELAGLLGEWPDSSVRTTLYYSLQKGRNKAVEQALAQALERETDAVMVKRAAGALMIVLGQDARTYLERSRDRFQNRAKLRTYFDSQLRGLDNPNSHGRGVVQPPGAPK